MRFRLCLTTVIALVCLATTAYARGPRGAYQTDNGFGVGIMLGTPTGLAGKLYLDSGRTALAFGVGSYYEHDHYDDLHIHMDVLWHPVTLARTARLSLPLYLGVGGRFLDHGHYHGDTYHGDEHIGVRVPFGLLFDFRRVSLDLFVELVPVFDVWLDNDDDHHRHAGLTGAFGLRYYF